MSGHGGKGGQGTPSGHGHGNPAGHSHGQGQGAVHSGQGISALSLPVINIDQHGHIISSSGISLQQLIADHGKAIPTDPGHAGAGHAGVGHGGSGSGQGGHGGAGFGQGGSGIGHGGHGGAGFANGGVGVPHSSTGVGHGASGVGHGSTGTGHVGAGMGLGQGSAAGHTGSGHGGSGHSGAAGGLGHVEPVPISGFATVDVFISDPPAGSGSGSVGQGVPLLHGHIGGTGQTNLLNLGHQTGTGGQRLVRLALGNGHQVIYAPDAQALHTTLRTKRTTGPTLTGEDLLESNMFSQTESEF